MVHARHKQEHPNHVKVSPRGPLCLALALQFTTEQCVVHLENQMLQPNVMKVEKMVPETQGVRGHAYYAAKAAERDRGESETGR